MVNQSKKSDLRFQEKWEKAGAIGAGKAYAFFDCNASREKIEGEVPFIRELVQSSGRLELSLAEGMDKVTGDPKLLAIAQEAKKAGIKYFMQASYPGVSNESTARELSTVINQAYQSPLYQEGEKFRGDIVYKKRGNYVSVD